MSFLDKVQPHLLSPDLLVQETVLNAIKEYSALPADWMTQLLHEAFSNEEKLTSILIYTLNQPIEEEA